MKKIVPISFLFSLSLLNVHAQRSNKFATLDRYFAGIPLQSGFVQWFDYISTQPFLGLDSTTTKGNFSSFKPGIESYFPFPDSMKVRIVFHKTIVIDTNTNQFVDSFKTIAIEGVFGADKKGETEAAKFYKGLKRELKINYGYVYNDYHNPASWFTNGKSNKFPNCSLHLGYSKERKLHYVMLSYHDGKPPKKITYISTNSQLKKVN